jgi:hypothetical protein
MRKPHPMRQVHCPCYHTAFAIKAMHTSMLQIYKHMPASGTGMLHAQRANAGTDAVTQCGLADSSTLRHARQLT